MVPAKKKAGAQPPTYDLKKIKEYVGKGNFLLIEKAIQDADKLGFSESEVGEVILNLTKLDFHNSIPSDRVPAQYLDVYHTLSRGIPLYIKLRINPRIEVVVLSFKRDTSQ